MTVKERIKAYCKEEKMAISTFEKTIGASNGYVNSITKSIGIDNLNIIVERFSNLNIEWLLTGRGEMLKTKEHTESSPMLKEPIIQNKNTNNKVNNQENKDIFSADIIANLINTIQTQAEEIGQLRERIAQLQREKGKNAGNAQASDIASVG